MLVLVATHFVIRFPTERYNKKHDQKKFKWVAQHWSAERCLFTCQVELKTCTSTRTRKQTKNVLFWAASVAEEKSRKRCFDFSFVLTNSH